jgi:hypothetical protein
VERGVQGTGGANREQALTLIARYAHAVDAGDVAAVLDCMVDDIALSYDGGRIQITGRGAAEHFFKSALVGPSTHLLANHLFERDGPEARVRCSGIACVSRNPGAFSVRGLVYVFDCTLAGPASRIRRLEHDARWEFTVPVGATARP